MRQTLSLVTSTLNHPAKICPEQEQGSTPKHVSCENIKVLCKQNVRIIPFGLEVALPGSAGRFHQAPQTVGVKNKGGTLKTFLEISGQAPS